MVAAPEAKTWACNFLEVVISISAGNMSSLSCRLAWRSWPRTNGLDSGVGSVGKARINCFGHGVGQCVHSIQVGTLKHGWWQLQIPMVGLINYQA